MKLLKYVLAILLVLLSIGCPTRSLSPLFGEKDRAILPGVVGTWINANGAMMAVRLSEQKSYQVILKNTNGETGVYDVAIGRLGNGWFLDSYPAGGTNDRDYHMIRTHVLSRIQVTGDTLQIASLEGDWVKKMADSGKIQIAYVMTGGDVLLTAQTEEVQQLLRRYADDPGAFPKKDKYVRLQL